MKNEPIYEDEFLDEIEATAIGISNDVMDAVTEAFEGADIDLPARKIIWRDGKRLTIEQSAQKISMQTGVDIVAITPHIIGWLTMEFVPKGLNQEQMDSFEDQMDKWLKAG
ncbi:MAG: hypothetical protein GY862_02110 [Gammaproteobacteria bacterium]|nr:hypothetical protein [Gammaproteobacteria bacterium]